MKTAGPSGRFEPPPMVMPKLLDRATERSWMTPSPGWLTTHRWMTSNRSCSRRSLFVGIVDQILQIITCVIEYGLLFPVMRVFSFTWGSEAWAHCCYTCSGSLLDSTAVDSGSVTKNPRMCCQGIGLLRENKGEKSRQVQYGLMVVFCLRPSSRWLILPNNTAGGNRPSHRGDWRELKVKVKWIVKVPANKQDAVRMWG